MISTKVNRTCHNNNNTETLQIIYKDLEIETTRMWRMKTETILVVIGAHELIKKGQRKHTKKIPGAININELRKITLLGTAHSYQPCCAPGPWFGPGPSGVYSRLNSKNSRNNNNNNNNNN